MKNTLLLLMLSFSITVFAHGKEDSFSSVEFKEKSSVSEIEALIRANLSNKKSYMYSVINDFRIVNNLIIDSGDYKSKSFSRTSSNNIYTVEENQEVEVGPLYHFVFSNIWITY